MYTVISCLVYEHNWYLVLVAATICILSNITTVSILRRVRNGGELSGSQWTWLGFAAASGGFGIWATHFVAMIAYEPGFPVTYALTETLLSLLIAVVSSIMAIAVAATHSSPAGAVGAGLIFGLGVSSMHFTGMSALQFGGQLVWDRSLVVWAIIVCALVAPVGFWILGQRRRGSAFIAAATLTLAIVSLHFTAMGAAVLVPGPDTGTGVSSLSKPWMITTILVVCMSLITCGAVAFNISLKAERSAKRATASFDLLVSGVTDYAIYMLDRNGLISNWNAGAARAKGYLAEEIVGEHFSVFYSEEDQDRQLPEQALKQALQQGRYEAEGWRIRRDGSAFWASVLIQPIHNEGTHVGYAKITRDITDQRASQDRIEQVSRNLDLALQSMIQGICLFDREEKLVLSNHRYSEIFGFDPAFVRPGVSYRELVNVGYQTAIPDTAEAERRAKEHYNKSMEAIRSSQRSLIHRIAGDRVVLANFNELSDGGWVATFEDITERMQSEERIAFLAKNDSLTKLPNRPAFTDYASHEIAFAEHSGGKVALFGLDLNKFKLINDQLGHGVGDRVLQELASRMSSILQPNEVIARFGGDEFAAVKRYEKIDEITDFVARLTTELSRPIVVDDHHLSCGASIGVALYPENGTSLETLLANADLAMYRAKQSIGQDVCYYDREMDDAARSRARMARDLWSAIEENQFSVHYQVQKSVATGVVTGYEALLRWTHPQRGKVSPVEFIPVAEECGAIISIGEWVLTEACREAVTWPNGQKVAVNLSPVQFAHTDILALVQKVLRETGLHPSRLELEITESSIIVDKDRAMAALSSLKAIGVAIAIDDFGTGYSSLDTLRSFPFDKIKLDRSFVAELQSNEESKAMIRAVLALGSGLGIRVLAEGVETDEQLSILKDEGCEEVQGYLLGKPSPVVVQEPGQVAA